MNWTVSSSLTSPWRSCRVKLWLLKPYNANHAACSLITLILPEMFLASATIGFAVSISLSRSWKALEISESVFLALCSRDFSMPPMPERRTLLFCCCCCARRGGVACALVETAQFWKESYWITLISRENLTAISHCLCLRASCRRLRKECSPPWRNENFSMLVWVFGLGPGSWPVMEMNKMVNIKITSD